MIWTVRGCWLQTVGENGRIVSSFCGLLDTKDKVCEWCREQHLEFVDHEVARGRRASRLRMAA